MVNENLFNILEPIKNFIPKVSKNSNNYFLILLEFIEKYSNINTALIRNKIKNNEMDNFNIEFEEFLENLLPFLLEKKKNDCENRVSILKDNLDILYKFISICIYENLPNKNFFENNIKMDYKYEKYFTKDDFFINSSILINNKEYIETIFSEVYELKNCKFIDNIERLTKLTNDYKEIIQNISSLIDIEINNELNHWVFEYNITNKYDIEKYKSQIYLEINEKIYINEKNKIIILINCIFYEILYLLENFKFK